MRRLLGIALLTILLTSSGCILFAPPETVAKVQPKESLVKAPPPVTPDQVTEDNCRQVMQALWDETDREYQRLMLNELPRE
jgi:hypothetical protein